MIDYFMFIKFSPKILCCWIKYEIYKKMLRNLISVQNFNSIKKAIKNLIKNLKVDSLKKIHKNSSLLKFPK